MPHVTYVELFVPHTEPQRTFYQQVFGWGAVPFGDDYTVAEHGDEPGIDTGIGRSEDGQARAVPVISVDSIDDAAVAVVDNGGTVVAPKFPIPGVGHGAYFLDPAGIMMGLFQLDDSAS